MYSESMLLIALYVINRFFLNQAKRFPAKSLKNLGKPHSIVRVCEGPCCYFEAYAIYLTVFGYFATQLNSN